MRDVIRTALTISLIGLAILSGACLNMQAKGNLNQASKWSPGALGVNAPIRRRAFSDENPFNQDISGRPVNASSAAYLANCGSAQLQADFGAPVGGNPVGLSYVAVDGSQVPVAVSFFDSTNSDPGPYPIPADAPVEDGNNSAGDRRVIVVDRIAGKLYEISSAYPDGSGGWSANAGAVFDLNIGLARADGKRSATASGMPLFPGLVRADEVLDVGEIPHALAFTCPNTANSHVAPATSDNGVPGSLLPPMGLRVRLRGDYEIPGTMPRTAQIILETLKKYGMFLVDNGTAFHLKGTADQRWNNDDLAALNAVLSTDLEVVD